LLYKILERTKCEYQKAVSIFTRAYLLDVEKNILVIQKNLNATINQLNSNLLNTISLILGNTQSTTAQRLLNEITQNNNIILGEINSLVTNANIQVKTNISSLATLTAADITSTIQDLTTQLGTLQQILKIISEIQTGTNSIFTARNKTLTSNITIILQRESIKFTSLVLNAVNQSSNQIGNIVGAAAAESFAAIVFNFKKLIENLTLTYKTLIQEYRNEVNRLIIEYFTCVR
jgi:hypothetical protein